MKQKIFTVIVTVLAWASIFNSVSAGEIPGSDESAASSQIIGKYLNATQDRGDNSRGASMEVDINASVPKLRENGRLHALRIISRFGRISYRVLGFQGSNTVKSQVIARYLQAEEQGQADQHLAITPVNYKFKLKGKSALNAREVYVFGLAPRRSDVGLFRGEIWLDASTCLPVFEKGRLAKNPSLFFKRVDFEREFSIRDGKAVPQSMSSIISTRIVGKVELNVSYSKYMISEGDGDGGDLGPLTTLSSQ